MEDGADQTLTGSDAARTAVHLREVQDRWAPYETMLEIETADELNDTALAAAFPLHTASPALSSNQFSLNEITEDNEDVDGTPKPLTHTPSISSVSSWKPTLEKRPPSQRSYRAPSFTSTSAQLAGDHSPVVKHKSSLSQFLVREELGHKSVTQLDGQSPAEDSVSIKDDAASIRSIRTESAIPLTSPTRTHTNESADYDLERYLDSFFKPKIKLGPRPVNVVEKGKNTPASATVSSLPAGVQFRSKQPLSHPQPQYPVNRNRLTEHAPTGTAAPPRLPSLHFSPQIPDIPEFLPPRPNSRGSSRSLPAPRASKAYLTPEKQRLMKALEMKKKQIRNTPSVESMPRLSAAQIVSPTTDSNQTQARELQHEAGSNKADSGIDIAHTPTAKEAPTSLLQEDLDPVAEAPVGQSDALFNAEGNQAHDLSTNSIEQSTMHEKLASTTSDNTALASESVEQEQPSKAEATELAIHNQEHIPAHGPATKVEESTDSLNDGAVTEAQDHTASDNLVIVQEPEKPIVPTISDNQNQPEGQGPTSNFASEDLQERDSFAPEIETSSEDPQKKRRRGLLEPLQVQVHLERHTSEHKFLADDDFMDELQTATFEQATPVAMSKSPASPFFPPRRPSSRSAKSSNSVTTADTESVPLVPFVSDTLEKRQFTPELLVPSSEPQFGLPNRTSSISSVRTTDSAPLMRKSNVSSGISARIAALAEKSTRDGSPPVVPESRKLSASSSIAQRKSSYIEQSAEVQAIGGAERRQVGKLSVWPAATPSNPSSSKTRNAQSNNRDSVSVTARIVRVPRAGEPANASELQASPLLFNHERSAPVHNQNPLTLIDTTSKPAQGENDSVMSPHSRDGIASRDSVETSATGRRKSMDRKSFKSLNGPSSPKKNALKQSVTMPPLDNNYDKTSRTSRFFKRISHLGKDKKKSAPQVPTITTTPSEPMSPTSVTRSGPTSPAAVAVASVPETVPESKTDLAPPTVARNPAVAAVSASKPRPDSIADVPPPVSIGDFNVQFPDAMLWKRRWIQIDSTGHLIFTAAARHSSISKSFNSKFHLKELGPPFIPDLDRQEMPHSVICDLVQGEGSIQCASEDAMSQRQLLSRKSQSSLSISQTCCC